jgi:hypothetical protein
MVEAPSWALRAFAVLLAALLLIALVVALSAIL